MQTSAHGSDRASRALQHRLQPGDALTMPQPASNTSGKRETSHQLPCMWRLPSPCSGVGSIICQPTKRCNGGAAGRKLNATAQVMGPGEPHQLR